MLTNNSLISNIDHIDREAWREIFLLNSETKFIVPELLREQLQSDLDIHSQNMIAIDDDLHLTVGGIEITAIAAAHECLDLDESTKIGLNCSI
ncbi:MAG: hypothetical protein OCC45_03490 [Desulfotalea sp.]